MKNPLKFRGDFKDLLIANKTIDCLQFFLRGLMQCFYTQCFFCDSQHITQSGKRGGRTRGKIGAFTHTHTHTHRVSLSQTQTYIQTFSLFLSFLNTHKVAHTHKYTHSCTLMFNLFSSLYIDLLSCNMKKEEKGEKESKI